MLIIKLKGGKTAFALLKGALENGAKTLGLATGSTPLSFYKEIANSNLDFSEMTSINLDRYVGLAAIMTKVIIILCRKIFSNINHLRKAIAKRSS